MWILKDKRELIAGIKELKSAIQKRDLIIEQLRKEIENRPFRSSFLYYNQPSKEKISEYNKTAYLKRKAKQEEKHHPKEVCLTAINNPLNLARGIRI